MRGTFTHLVVLALSLTACSAGARRLASPGPGREASVLSKPLPFAHAFVRWHDNHRDSSSNENPLDLQAAPAPCGDGTLYPTHPSMVLKQYANSRWAEYDARKLKAEDSACTVPNRGRRASAEGSCARADNLLYTVVSDAYEDACGTLFRGYSEALFFRGEETMGSLFSKGRALYPRPGSYIPGDLIAGGTYGVPASEFFLLTNLSARDAAAIPGARAESLRAGFTYDPRTRLFQAPGR